LYEGDENVGSVPFTTNLDTWDGMRWRHLQAGCHLGVVRYSNRRMPAPICRHFRSSLNAV
jgi:hypothetical protein